MTPSRTSSEKRAAALRYVPGVLGAVLVIGGAALIAIPLGAIALGVFLLLIDRRLN